MIYRFTPILFASLMALASANPFAPAQSKNDAKTEHMSKLLRKATPTANSQLRRLNDEYEMDLTPYSLKFMQCQFVKAYDDDMADDEDSATVLGTQRFVTFRLCPDCDSCSSEYGEYIVDLQNYLESMIDYYQEEQENYCKACEECAGMDADADAGDADADAGGRRLDLDCQTCYPTCQNIENMEENGYLDASEFIECQQMGDANDDGSAYYTGPMCSNGGTKIKIGVFTDDLCTEFAEDGTDVDTLFQAQADAEGDANAVPFRLSYHLLKKVHDSSNCVSCLVEDNDADANDDAEVAEVCEELYEEAAKCETPYGFDGVLSSGDEEYANQAANEETVCTFIKAVNGGVYDEKGEISLSSSNVSTGGGSGTSGAQKFFLSAFVIGTIGLLAYGATLHSQLTREKATFATA